MAQKDTKRPTPSIANSEETGGTPPVRLRTKLTTIGDVRRELAKLYREARAKKVDTQDASRMANMLSILGRLIEGSELERRLDALERTAGKEGSAWLTRH